MTEDPAVQWARGNGNVQIRNVSGSTIRITLGDSGRSWHVQLEPATAPVGAKMTSPARLVRARSGVLPYVDRAGHLAGLSEWIGAPDPFAVCVVGGRGGSGKTRLGVELCELTATRAGWLSGLLPRSADPAALRDLCDTPNPRLVVIDYAETRIEQLEIVLPALQQAASDQYPVRVLLLVRAAPQLDNDWVEALHGGSDWLESVLDDAEMLILEDSPPSFTDRMALFNAAAGAFAGRVDPPIGPAEVACPDLSADAFANPLFIVVAAYLTVHNDQDLSSTRIGLLDGLLKHEDRYWASTASAVDASDDVLRRRVVALATLAGAGAGAETEAQAETEAAEMLRHLPDLGDAPAKWHHELARWVHAQYPGAQWWNPLEPDLLGEHLVSTALGGFPDVLAAVLDRENPASLIQPLDIYARAAVYDDKLATTLHRFSVMPWNDCAVSLQNRSHQEQTSP